MSTPDPVELEEFDADHWVVRGVDGDADVALHRAANPRALVVVPYYEVDSPWGRPTLRDPGRSAAERAARAHAALLAEDEVDVLTVGWWAETCRSGDLEQRYGAAARRRLAEGRGPGIARSVADLIAAVDHHATLGRVERIVGFGHSLGAKHLLAWAAVDARPSAIALSEPGFLPGTNNWSAPWYTDDPDFDVDVLLRAAAGRRVLCIGGGDADDAVSLGHATRVLGSGAEMLLHDRGHQPPPHVVAAARAWLLA